MKNTKRFLTLIFSGAALFGAAMSSSCSPNGSNGGNVAVTGVKLNFTETTRVRNTTFTLKPIILPENATDRKVTWESLDSTIATVNDEGVVATLASGQATINVKTADGGFIGTCVLTVEKTCDCEKITVDDPGTVKFITDKTWTVGNQIWSDDVTATRCQKETYKGGHKQDKPDDLGKYQTDCRSNPGYGDLFSWCAVIRFQDKLCPDGWRIPTQKEFVALDIALGGTGSTRMFENATEVPFIKDTYLNPDKWGGTLGGDCWYDGKTYDQNEAAFYWGSTEAETCNGAVLYIQAVRVAVTGGYFIDPCIAPADFMTWFDLGYRLRCIKDIGGAVKSMLLFQTYP